MISSTSSTLDTGSSSSASSSLQQFLQSKLAATQSVSTTTTTTTDPGDDDDDDERKNSQVGRTSNSCKEPDHNVMIQQLLQQVENDIMNESTTFTNNEEDGENSNPGNLNTDDDKDKDSGGIGASGTVEKDDDENRLKWKDTGKVTTSTITLRDGSIPNYPLNDKHDDTNIQAELMKKKKPQKGVRDTKDSQNRGTGQHNEADTPPTMAINEDDNVFHFENLLIQVDELDQHHKDYVFQQVQDDERWEVCGWSITTTSLITNSITSSQFPTDVHNNTNSSINDDSNGDPTISIHKDKRNIVNMNSLRESDMFDDSEMVDDGGVQDYTVMEELDLDPNEEQALADITKVYPDLLNNLKGQLNPTVWLYQVGLLGGNTSKQQCILFGSDSWWKQLCNALETEATISGNAEIQFVVGEMYNDGLGIPIDTKQAFRWWQLAANQGHAKAQYNLGTMYESGQGAQQDHNKAIVCYQLASNQGHAKAQYNLGNMHYNGIGVPQDYMKAMEYYKSAASHGLVEAQYNLGVMYYCGEGVSQHYAKALEYYELAADQGDPCAQNNLGDMHWNGQGVTQDRAKAMECYQLAANQGHSQAQYNLLFLGNVREDEQSSSQIFWYEL